MTPAFAKTTPRRLAATQNFEPTTIKRTPVRSRDNRPRVDEAQ